MSCNRRLGMSWCWKLGIVLAVAGVYSCDDSVVDPPPLENSEELITDVILRFSAVDGGEDILVEARDPDGEGPLDLQVTDSINLAAGGSYVLSIELFNTEDLTDIQDITEEVKEEAQEHMFFFEWTQDLFSSPGGGGNTGNRMDPVNYTDQDENGYPLGLLTEWIAGSPATGLFRVILKHQPEVNGTPVKSETSTASDGETDVDITWDVVIQ